MESVGEDIGMWACLGFCGVLEGSLITEAVSVELVEAAMAAEELAERESGRKKERSCAKIGVTGSRIRAIAEREVELGTERICEEFESSQFLLVVVELLEVIFCALENTAASNCEEHADGCDCLCDARNCENSPWEVEVDGSSESPKERIFLGSGCEFICVPVKNATKSASPTSLTSSAFNSATSSVFVTL